jgi:hypothetical protein
VPTLPTAVKPATKAAKMPVEAAPIIPPSAALVPSFTTKSSFE